MIYLRIMSFCHSFADIECARIQGFLKDLNYIPGDAIGERVNHEWNAVRVNGTWRLVDVTFASGYLTSNKTYVRYHEVLPLFHDPAEFIHTHFPENSRWQLLNTPMTRMDFEQEVVYHPGFFLYDVISCDQPHAVLSRPPSSVPAASSSSSSSNNNIKSNVTVVKVKLTSYRSLIYSYILQDTRRRKQYNSYVSYCYTGMQTCFSITAPFTGVFHFTVFGKTIGSKGSPIPLLSYCIRSDDAVTDITDTFLQNQPSISWGTTQFFDGFRLIPADRFSTHLNCASGRGQLEFYKLSEPNSEDDTLLDDTSPNQHPPSPCLARKEELELSALLICFEDCECRISEGVSIIITNEQEDCKEKSLNESAVRLFPDGDVSSYTKCTLSFTCPHEGVFQLELLGRYGKEEDFVCLSQHYVNNRG